MLIVGYDDVNQCFIVKNSWGTGWGESGYFRIAYSQLSSSINFGGGTLTYYGSLSAPSISVTRPAAEPHGRLPGVTLTFGRVSGTGTIPAKVQTASDGKFGQTGFVSGTTYKMTPSKPGYAFSPKNLTSTNGSIGLNFIGTQKNGKK